MVTFNHSFTRNEAKLNIRRNWIKYDKHTLCEKLPGIDWNIQFQFKNILLIFHVDGWHI
jgi:hypothetical protein